MVKQKYAAQGQMDISYLWTDEGWLYLSIVLDLFNREVVGWSLKPRMTTDIVTEALTMACFRRKPAVGLMHHSDRGSQYASQPFQDTLKAQGMAGSMSRKGNCWDHVPTESGFNVSKRCSPTGLDDTRRWATSHRCSLLDDWRMAQHDEHLVA